MILGPYGFTSLGIQTADTRLLVFEGTRTLKIPLNMGDRNPTLWGQQPNFVVSLGSSRAFWATKAKKSCQDSAYSPLMLACIEGNYQDVQLVLESQVTELGSVEAIFNAMVGGCIWYINIYIYVKYVKCVYLYIYILVFTYIYIYNFRRLSSRLVYLKA